MPVIPYVKAGAPFIDHASDPAATFAAADANQIETGIYDAHLQPCVHVTHSADVSIANATLTNLDFDTERYDQAGGAAAIQHTSGDTHILVCRYAGIYAIAASVAWNDTANTSGIRLMQVIVNAAQIAVIDSRAWSGGTQTDMHVSTHWPLQVNDYLHVQVYQNSGAAKAIRGYTGGTVPYSPNFMMARVG